MTAEKYVKSIVKKVSCSGQKKKDIKKQLLSEIEERMQKGETAKEIMEKMGSIQEMADSFNESLSDKEMKAHKRNKVLIILACIAVFLAVVIGVVYWWFPKPVDMEKSGYFNKAEVDQMLCRMINDCETDNYEDMRANSAAKLSSLINDADLQNAKAQIGKDWGAQKQMGNILSQELVQMGKHSVINQVTVSYENVNVTYTISFDQDMKMQGFYIK